MTTPTQSKHTQGPWVFDLKTRNVLAIDGRIIARIGDSVYGEMANARLIAASPTLLEACKNALPFFESMFEHATRHTYMENSEEYSIMEELKSAITKAEGKD